MDYDLVMPRRRVREAQRERSFDEVAVENVQFVYNCMIGWVRDLDTARDLTQETFVRAAAGWHRFDSRKGKPEQWLFGIARHVRDDHFRSTAKDKSLRDKLGEDMSSDPTEGAVELMDPQLRNAFLQLSEGERELLWQCEVLEIPMAEVARSLGIKRSTCSMRRKRALRKVRDLMGPVKDA